jgi:hypothetical protein
VLATGAAAGVLPAGPSPEALSARTTTGVVTAGPTTGVLTTRTTRLAGTGRPAVVAPGGTAVGGGPSGVGATSSAVPVVAPSAGCSGAGAVSAGRAPLPAAVGAVARGATGVAPVPTTHATRTVTTRRGGTTVLRPAVLLVGSVLVHVSSCVRVPPSGATPAAGSLSGLR